MRVFCVGEKMKTPSNENGWRVSMQILPIQRHRHHKSSSVSRPRPWWIIILLVCLISLFLVCGYLFPPSNNNYYYYKLQHQQEGWSSACYIFSCKTLQNWLPAPPMEPRPLTDDEIMSQIVVSEILNTQSPRNLRNSRKIAFMFLTPGSLPFEKLWDLFFRGNEGRFTVYVHASRDKPVHQSSYFIGSDIPSDKVEWGQVSMVAAEKRLLATALRDPDNQHFVLLSDSCVPLRSFDYIYDYLLDGNVSFIESFIDPGPHGNGRYSEHMLPEVEEKHFRKGAQWFTMKRQHAIIVMADTLYYSKFRQHCRPGMPHDRNCYSDEHYLQTFFSMIDPMGISNWSVTHVDWSEHKWHPKSYGLNDVTYELLQNMTSIDYVEHVTSGEQRDVKITPCIWNGMQRPCHLFARKFCPETLDTMMQLFSNYTSI